MSEVQDIQKIINDGKHGEFEWYFEMPFTVTDNMVSLGVTYGIIRNENGKCIIDNKVYAILIYDHMIAKMLRSEVSRGISEYNFRSNFIINNQLNIEKILQKFQQFMKEQYSTKDASFLEREGRLLLLAFIKPIINGQGFDFKEVQISEEKRLDVVITFHNNKYVLELKRWMGQKAHERGLDQLMDYLKLQGLNKGYLVIFDFSKNKEENWQEDKIEIDGKEITMVRV